MKLILLRHGETEEEREGVILGHLPGTLSAEGKEQAKKVAEFIKSANLNPEIIIASDLARTADYAAILGRELGLSVELEPLARERCGGVAEGHTEKEIDWVTYEKIAKPLRKHLGGESFEDVGRRAREFLDKIAPRKFDTVALVSHSVFLAMLTIEICAWTLDQALKHDFRQPLVIDTNEKRAEFLPIP